MTSVVTILDPALVCLDPDCGDRLWDDRRSLQEIHPTQERMAMIRQGIHPDAPTEKVHAYEDAEV